MWSTCIGSFDAEGVLEPQATSITIDGNDNLHLCGATNSYTDYPLADGGGPPVYFQAQKAGGSFAPSDGTVSRFSLIPINAIVGIKEQPVSVSFGLYPNPTTQYLMLDNPELSERKSQYAVYNMTGQKVQDGMLSSQTKIIDVSLLPQGLYIIKLSNQTGTLSTKFIKVND